MSRKALLPLLALAGLFAPPAAPARAEPALEPYAQLRWRLEAVDQDGFGRDALASTLRLRGGVRAHGWHGLSARIEGEGVRRIGPERFNDTVNGETGFPVVADPPVLLLNQAVLRWDRAGVGGVAVGRQVINLDNQRWVGSVDWRQNDQTMDAVRLDLTPAKAVSASYARVWRVNRVFGPDSAQGVWRDSDIHLMRAGVEVAKAGTLVGYGWLLDVPDAPAASSTTIGARFSGKRPLGKKGALLYALEGARQRDRGPNPADFALSYLLIEPGLSWGAVTLKGGIEQLGGDGRAALQTPLATLHAFNGWADKFLVTPPAGLSDRYVDLSATLGRPGPLKGLGLRAVVHDFRAEEGGARYGREVDVQAALPVGRRVRLLAKAAFYDARGFSTDTDKLWVQAEVSF